MKVTHNVEDGSIVCTCRHFLRYGLLCRHCFWVLKNANIDEIPQQYVLRRWRRDIIPPELRTRVNRYGNVNVPVQNMANEVTSIVDECMHLLSNDEKRFQEFVEKMKVLKTEIEANVQNPPSKKKDDVIVKLIGVSKPDTIEIENPPVGRYKGCGKDKRLMSGKEEAMKENSKRKLVCSRCGETSHNIRTCKKPAAEQEKKKQRVQVQDNQTQIDAFLRKE